MLISEYGELLNVKPMLKERKAVDYRDVQMINDNTESKELLQKMHHNPNMFFLFDPKGHFTNAQSLYMAMKRMTNETFYGRKGKRDKRTEKSPHKGTVFEKCSLPYELFNMNRMVKLNIKQMLSRLGFLVLRDGSLETQGKNKPELPALKSILGQLESGFELGSFDKPDYYCSFPFMEGVISAEA